MKRKSYFKILSIFAIVFLIISAISSIIIKNKPKQLNNFAALTPEDKRAMNYSVVTDESSAVEETEFVKFNAFFLKDLDNDGYAEKYNGTCKDISENTLLYMDLNVLTEGKLVDGQITINGQNFDFGMSMIADDVLKNNYISENVTTIELKDVNAGTQKLIFGKITPKINNDTNNYSNNFNSITFTGRYIPLEGEPVEINKTVNLQVDWYGTTTAYMEKSTKYDVSYDRLEDNTLKFNFLIREEDKKLLLKGNYNTIKIPELCGYAPISVRCTKGGTYNYDPQTRELTITKESIINGNGIITKTLTRANSYTVAVQYPDEAYRAIGSYETIKFDIEGYFIGYNNTNEEFQNPYKSNVAKDTVEFLIRKQPKANIFNFYVDYVDKRFANSPYNKYVISNQDVLNVYNDGEIPTSKKFIVRWQAARGNQGVVPSMIMKETQAEQQYGDKWDDSLIEDYIENTGIYFTGADEMLGEEGTIAVYNNDTNELVKMFTSDEWNTYTTTNPFVYNTPIKHIRVETSKASNNSLLSVYNVKELNVEEFTSNFTADEVRNFIATHTYLQGICNIEGAESGTVTTSDIAYFIHDKSKVEISLEKKNAIVYEKLENQKIFIDTLKESSDDAKWENGVFLVEFPKEIMSLEINSVTLNKDTVEIKTYELYQDETGKYFIKVFTKNEQPENYKITIDCNLMVDPRVATVARKFKLYAFNELTREYLSETEDIYDVNQNNNKAEKVGNAETTINIFAPTSLLTMETVSNYNDDNEITIAPNVALIESEKRNATINVQLTNNYANTVSDVKVVGKIPYKNNSYIINPKDLKSEFTTQMSSNGIVLPENTAIKNNAIIYYSEKLNPTNDFNNEENGWKSKDEVEDWSKIVSYLIYIKDYNVLPGEEILFNYNIILPENPGLNEAAYSTHAVYFDLHTDGGKIKLYTEPTKVGVKIVKKFNFELTKFKINSTKVIPGVSYIITHQEKNSEGEIETKQRIVTTDDNGKIILDNLLASTEYTIKEFKAPIECELNEEEITFYIDENGAFTVNGNVKSSLFENNTVKLSLEDEVRAKIRINKTKKETDIKINNVVFDVVDEDGEHTTGQTKNGFAEIPGISIGKTYTLTEKATPNQIEKNEGIFKFKLTRQSSNIDINVIENTLLKGNCIFENIDSEISPIINVNVEDEIRYSLNITKKDTEGNLVPNVKFLLTEGENTTGVKAQTNSIGECSILRLELGKTYTLKEISAPGYYTYGENDYITFKIERDSNGVLKIAQFDINGNVNIINTPTLEEDGLSANLNITLENEKIPTYDLKIVKKNEDGLKLKNARFKLKRLFDGYEIILRTDENGEAIFTGLYEDIVGKSVTGEYELTETFSPEGYKLSNSVLKFSATRDVNGKLVFKELGEEDEDLIRILPDSGEKEIISNENMITLGIVNKPLFSLIKYGDNGRLLPDAKFTITDLNNNFAKDVNGNFIGEYDETNDRYVVRTDNNGKIKANIAKGVYKAIEIEAPEGYKLPTDVSDRIYYFGIDESQDAIYSDYEAEYSWSVNSQDAKYLKVYNVNDGLIVYGKKSDKDVLIKFDYDGVIIWSKELSTSTLCYFKMIDEENYELLVKYTNANYLYDGNLIATVQDKDNYVKINVDKDGTFIEGTAFEVGDKTKYTKYIGDNESGNIIIQDNKVITEYNVQGVLQNQIELPMNATVINNNNGYLAVFKTTSTRNIAENIEVENGTYAVYYDLNGNYKWHKKIENTVTEEGYNGNGFVFYNSYCNENNEFILVGTESIAKNADWFDKCLRVIIISDSGEIKNSFVDKLIYTNIYYDKGMENLTCKDIKYTDVNGNVKSGFQVTYYFKDLSNEYNTGVNVYDSSFNPLWKIYEFEYGTRNLLSDAEKVGNTYYTVGNSPRTSNGVLDEYEGICVYPSIAAAQEVTVTNEIYKYDITTEIARDIFNYRRGGTVTGVYNDKYPSSAGKMFAEEVKYGHENEQEIIAQSDDGYYVYSITVDGEEINFSQDETGKVVIPAGYFENVTQNHHIVVKFQRKACTLLIQKNDENGNPLKGAKFEVKMKNGNYAYISNETNEQGKVYVYLSSATTYIIKEIQAPEGYMLSDDQKEVSLSNGNTTSVTIVNKEQPKVTIEKKDEDDNNVKGAKFEIKSKEYQTQLGELIDNGPEQPIKDDSAQYPEYIGSIINKNSSYYFVENNGKYIPNNIDMSGMTGTAWSCFKIDLTNQNDDYLLEVDITKNILDNNTNNMTNDIFGAYISESEDANSGVSLSYLNSTTLQGQLAGGKVYYLHFTFYRFYGNSGTRTLSINGINLFKVAGTVSYNFIENNGAYEPNNSYVINSSAWSYIPLDLTNCEGEYEIIANAEINTPYSTSNSGYVFVTDSTDVPNTSSAEGCVAKLSNTAVIEATAYSTIVEGGKQYYIHFGYIRGNDKKNNGNQVPVDFKINSIEVKQIIDKYYITTDENGIATIKLKKYGKYVVKEVEAPEGYILSDIEKNVELTEVESDKTVDFVNERAHKVIVHHYLEGTGEEYDNEPVVLAEEEIKYGKTGEKYTTAPNMEIEGYTLVKTQEGKYKIPENAADVFADKDIHVYYYYNTVPVKLTVHHYLEGTEDKLIDDEITKYTKGEHYKTEVAEELLETYDFVETVGDVEKDITEDEEVTYYYAKKQHNITTKVETISYFGKPEKGGIISGEEQNPYEVVEHGDSNIKEIIMIPKDGFKIDQVLVNQSENGRDISSDEVDFIPDVDNTYELPQIQNVENDYEVVVRYVPDMGKVIVHHYIEGTDIKLAPDEIIIDEYGSLIKTKPLDENETIGIESFRRYILVSSPSQPNVIADREDQELSYYYNVQYRITTEVIPHNEIINGQNTNVKGGSISGENDKPYEIVMRGNNSNKVIKTTPNDGYKITKITINGETYDFSSRIAEDRTVTLDNFTNMTEDKHVTVEYEKAIIPAKVIVKYLEEGTDKILKTEETKEGFVGDEYRTSRATIEGYEKSGEDPVNANGTMAENDIVVIYYYKKIQEQVIPTPAEPEETDIPIIPDEPDITVKPDTKEETKDSSEDTKPSNDNSIKNNENSPQTGDNILVIITVVIVSIILLLISKKYKNIQSISGKHI